MQCPAGSDTDRVLSRHTSGIVDGPGFRPAHDIVAMVGNVGAVLSVAWSSPFQRMFSSVLGFSLSSLAAWTVLRNGLAGSLLMVDPFVWA